MTSTGGYACAECDLRFSSRNLLFRHLRDAHGLAQPATSHDEKVALTFGYLGSAYHGSQRSDAIDAVATAEGELWKAIGTVEPKLEAERHARTNPAGFSRAARTDRGVHAVCNVVALSLPALSGQFTRWLERVNAALPPDVRLLRRCRAANDFHAQRLCERRRYEYLLPQEALVPPTAVGGGGGTVAEDVVRTRQRLKALLRRFRGTRDYRHFTRQGAAYQAGHDTCRHIFKIYVPEATEHAGRAYLTLSICGNSFLYHMIRKLVGAVVAVMRGALREAWLDSVLLPPPKARHCVPRRLAGGSAARQELLLCWRLKAFGCALWRSPAGCNHQAVPSRLKCRAAA